jgi:hypothetical protein
MEELLLLSNMHGVSDVRWTEMHAVETFISEPSPLGVEIAIEKLKKYDFPGIAHTLVELILAGHKTLCL